MTTNLVIRMTTMDDKSESENGIAWKGFLSDNVLTASFWRSGNDTLTILRFTEDSLRFNHNDCFRFCCL